MRVWRRRGDVWIGARLEQRQEGEDLRLCEVSERVAEEIRRQRLAVLIEDTYRRYLSKIRGSGLMLGVFGGLREGGRRFQQKAGETGEVFRLFVARGGEHEGFDLLDRADAAARTFRHAVDGGGGAGEVEAAGKRPALEESVDEAGAEDVAGARGVDDGDAEGGSVVELLSIPRQNSIVSESGGREPAAEAALHLAESGLEVGFAGEAEGEVVID